MVDITANKDGGLLKEVLREGDEGGEHPLCGDTVSVHYVGTLLDGTKFDSSRDRGEKFSFEVGKGSVIKGWDQGIPTMRRNELARFTIRADYGYGAKGSPPTIPPEATLVFEVELFDFQGEDLTEQKDKSVVRRTLNAGAGYTTPNEGSRCVINLKGVEDASGRVFDERAQLEFEIGEGAACNIPEGLELALVKFKKAEKSLVYLKASRAWGSSGCADLGIGANASVHYEVEMVSFEKAKESWQLNGKEKIEQAELLKNKGAELFKGGKFTSALKKYKKMVEFLENETYELDEERNESTRLQLAANLNIAACCLKTKSYTEAIERASKALELDAKNEKATFRVGQAYFGLSEFATAATHFAKCVEINAENKEALSYAALCKQKVKEYQEKEKALYTKMFSGITSK